MPSGVNQAVADLIKSGKVDDEPTYATPKMQVDDIYPIFQKYFSPEAQQALKIKAGGLLHQRNELVDDEKNRLILLLSKLGLKSCEGVATYVRKADVVHFCASRADRSTVHKAAEKVIVAINDLAKNGYITAALIPLSVVSLAPVERIEPEYVVLSYVAVTQPGEAYIAATHPKMFIKEGQTPLRFEEQ